MSETDKVTREYLEWCLYNYKANKIKLKIFKRNLEQELEVARGLSGVNYDKEVVSETNETSDPTGDFFKREEQVKKRYYKRIKKKREAIEMADMAISLMTEREKKLITRKYIDGRKWVDIAIDHDIDLTAGHCRRIRKEAMDRVLELINLEKEELLA